MTQAASIQIFMFHFNVCFSHVCFSFTARTQHIRGRLYHKGRNCFWHICVKKFVAPK